MNSAYRWFRDDNITIAEAAERCGYLTEAAFSKAFKSELGISPGKVRASLTA
jgi:AraC-like DNA-binding protein